ncbi:SOS response-associated peptidase [Salinisphaera sp. T31B1]|uniref:SOS response-associated peptidase n=1 Tax=Salinisphaera sp. T31B1 TaxID=727963 RepID=UPI00333E6B7D
MCGRYGRTTSAAHFAKLIEAATPDDVTDGPGYNLPPGGMRACALRTPRDNSLKMGSAWWGLIPSGAKDEKFAPINARSETAASKQPFSNAFQKRRLLCAADYWIEWQKREEGGKQPWLIRPADGEPFFFAGMWTQAKGLPSDHKLAGAVTFTILTGKPHDDIAHIHNRQPLALTNDAARAWVDAPADASVEHLHGILEDGVVRSYESWPISTLVNKPSNDEATIIERV